MNEKKQENINPNTVSGVLTALLRSAFPTIAGTISYLGALRGAGDTLVPTLYTTALAWGLCVVGGGLVMRMEPSWGASGPWIMATLYVCISGVWSLCRWNGHAWQKFNVLGAKLIQA